MGNYVHNPLGFEDSIRLLHVSRSKSTFQKCVVFELSEVRLSGKPKYEAMSYAWGSPKRQRGITHSGTSAQLRVTENCFSALYDLCGMGPRVLWVDAVCINQEDILERSKQVAMMAHIYMQAFRTVIYLGKSDGNSSNLVRLFQKPFEDRMEEILGIDRPAWQDNIALNIILPGYFDKRYADRWNRKTLPQLAKFFERPWFSRTWIIQEVLLSDRRQIVAYIGPDQVKWDIIRSWSKALELGDDDWNAQRPGMFELLDSYEGHIGTPARPFLNWKQLLEVLRRTANHNCSDPRDKIFALLSLFKDTTPKELKADYNRSLHNVYASTSRFLLEFRSQAVLEAARGFSGDPNLPTWAIDWRCYRPGLREGIGDHKGWGFGSGEREVAADDEPRESYFVGVNENVRPISDRCLKLFCWRAGTVKHVGKHRERLGYITPYWSDQSENMMKQGHAVYITFGNARQAVARKGVEIGDSVCVLPGFHGILILRATHKAWNFVGEGMELSDESFTTDSQRALEGFEVY